MATKKASKSSAKTVKAAAKGSAKATAKAAPKSMPKGGRDPKGGLTAKGREFFNERDGSHLRPGVQGPADTPEKMVRKGSFLRRHFAHPRGPMKDEKGEPTRLALSAHAWGEDVPQTMGDAKMLAAEGHELLEEYHRVKDGEVAGKKSAAKKGAAKKRAGAKGAAKKSPAKTSGAKPATRRVGAAADKGAAKRTR